MIFLLFWAGFFLVEKGGWVKGRPGFGRLAKPLTQTPFSTTLSLPKSKETFSLISLILCRK